MGRPRQGRHPHGRVRQSAVVPARNAGAACYYVPESLADDPECFPDEARPVQEFSVFTSRNYSESFAGHAVEATRLLLGSMKSGVRPGTVAADAAADAARTRSRRRPGSRARDDPVVHPDGRVQAPVFPLPAAVRDPAPQQRRLHAASVLEGGGARPLPRRAQRTDQRFFDTVDERRAYEQRFADRIERSLVWTDALLGELLELAGDDAILVVGTALGQKPHDPVHEIHNPVVRLVREDELFASLGFPDAQVLSQMNPDVSLTLADEATAERAVEAVRGLYVHPGKPLFEVERRGRQVFLELLMPRRDKGERCRPSGTRRAPTSPCRSSATSTSTGPTTSRRRSTTNRASCSRTRRAAASSSCDPTCRSPTSRRPSFRGSASRRSPG